MQHIPRSDAEINTRNKALDTLKKNDYWLPHLVCLSQTLQSKFFHYKWFSTWFCLQYTGTRQFREENNFNSATPNIHLIRQKNKQGSYISKGQFPHFPSIQISPLDLVPEKGRDNILIHPLIYPENESVNLYL